MINQDVLNRLRNSVCAIGYLREPLDAYAKHADVAGQFRVVGTGFLVRDGTVMTNRHVIDDLESETKREGIADSQRFLFFIVWRQDRESRELWRSPRQIRVAYSLRDTNLDVAFVQFQRVMVRVEPVILDDPMSIVVSEEIAVFGYPHGNVLLEKVGRVRRWGPVLQQGWISGISPLQGFGRPDEFLLDLRAADGISGSPVFRPATGKVCGVLHSGVTEDRELAVTTTAFAQPISEALLADWLAEFDLFRDSLDAGMDVR